MPGWCEPPTDPGAALSVNFEKAAAQVPNGTVDCEPNKNNRGCGLD